MKVTGTIRRSDLEGGVWVLETKSGERYQLVGDVATFRDGLDADVTGDVDRNMMSIGMMGPSLKVTKVEAKK
jgi:hypothetical protein